MPEDFDHAAAQTAFMENVDAQEAADPEAEAVAIADNPEPEADLGAVEGVPAHENVPTVDPYEQYGGEDTIKNAMIVANALKTEDGIRHLTARGLQTLGYKPADIEAFLAQQAAEAAYEGITPAAQPEASPWDGQEDDDILTVAQAKQLQADIQRQITEARDSALAPFQQQQEEARVAAVTYSVDQALIAAIGDPTAADPMASVDPAAADVILRVANSMAGDQVVTPQEASAFIAQAHAAVTQAAIAEQARYAAGKRATKDAIPTQTGGQGAGGDGAREPQTLKEADQAFFGLLGLPAPPR